MWEPRADFLLQQFLLSLQAFDWLTVLALFLVALFYLLPHLTGHTLNPRSRGCFIGATWVLVFKLFIHLVYVLLLNLSAFNSMVGVRQGGSPNDLAVIVMLFFPIIEGMFFVLALVLFVAGLPSMIRKEERWEPESPPPSPGPQ